MKGRVKEKKSDRDRGIFQSLFHSSNGHKRAELIQNLKSGAYARFPMWVLGPKRLESTLTASPGYYQGTGWDVEQLGPHPAPIWDNYSHRRRRRPADHVTMQDLSTL